MIDVSMDITRLAPSDVMLDEEALAEYWEIRDLLYEYVLQLNANIYIVEKIFKFPFTLFDKRMPRFFSMVVNNFLNIAVLNIINLVGDAKSDFHTLTYFKNELHLRFLKPKYRTAFLKHLKAIKFDKETTALLQKAKALRDGRLAHVKREYDADSTRLSLEEIRVLRDEVNELFDGLSFNEWSAKLPWNYYDDNSVLGARYPSDIEEILDSYARDSNLLNLPERQPAMWSLVQEELIDSDIDRLNDFRRKFGKSEVRRDQVPE